MTATSDKIVSRCCSTNGGPVRRRSILEIVQWFFSAGVLLAMPKCPMCFAAYVTVATGTGLSLATAASLRISLLALGGLSCVILTARLICRWRRPSPMPGPC